MALKVYNSMTNKKEAFEPLNPPNVGIYVCGVTVYDLSHIGHARSAIAFDIITRYLRYSGYDVNFIRNFTDVDDNIINRSNELGIETTELTEKFIQAFTDDMNSLGLLQPDTEPRCTLYIPEMVEFIKDLIEKDFAYPTESGDVYYRVNKFKGYGKLSGKNIDDLEAGARVEVNDEKESPLDFALWKASKPGEPKWESPWGEGRPGWHVECSVMSKSNLGMPFDIHGGGKDLLFPHHENEIAQSEAHAGHAYAKYWMHNGFVNVPSDDDPEGTKMSKSLGNFFTIRDVTAVFHPQAIKFFMLSTHYKKDILFTEDGLNKAQDRLAYFYETLKKATDFIQTNTDQSGELIDRETVEAIIDNFKSAMDDDFNTQRAFGQLSGVFKMMNELLSNDEAKPGDKVSTLKKLLDDIKEISGVLGIFDIAPDKYASDLKDIRAAQVGLSVSEIEGLIEDRKKAREDKNWGLADEIRDKLMEKGIILKDAGGVTDWAIKSS